MQLSFTDRLKHAWNVFKSRDPTDYWSKGSGYWSVSPFRPYYNKPYYGVSDHSIVTAIKNRIAVDAASVDIQHVRTDDSGRYVETLNSGLNRCLNLSANIDQTGRAFRLDVFSSLLDEGVIALLPVDVNVNPFDKLCHPNTGSLIFGSSVISVGGNGNVNSALFVFRYIANPYDAYREVKEILDDPDIRNPRY